jgi:hypothetical protein
MLRVLALLFALAGAGGAGLLGGIWFVTMQKAEADAAADKERGKTVKINEERLAVLKRATYALLAGIPLGVVGGVLAMNRMGKIAAALLLVTYLIPFVILSAGIGLDFQEGATLLILGLPGGLLVAAILAVCIGPGIPYKKPKAKDYIDEDDDVRG